MKRRDRTRPIDPDIERLVVVLDLTAQDSPAIRAAADLAARLGAALEGLFVEDANLFRLAALPVARQIPLGPSAGPAAFDPAHLERDLRAFAQRAETAFSHAARSAGVRWSFRAVRGDVPAAVLAEVAARDLLVVTTPADVRTALGGVGPVLCRAALEAERSFVLVSQPAGLRRPLVVIGRDAALARDTLGVAGQVFVGDGHTLDLALADDAPDAVKAAVAAWLDEHALKARMRRLATARVAQIRQAAISAGNDVLVLAGDLPCLAGGGADELAAGAPFPVIVVR